ncbi:MAG: SRPBCC domain-containing protein [Candidatus Nanopelagicales bacterium]
MEYGTIEREIQIDASPEVVFEVVSQPEHVREWWSDEATFGPNPGDPGELRFHSPDDESVKVAPFTVVKSEPPTLFSFRWIHHPGEVAKLGNSLLVTFELEPTETGTLVKMTESGFREMGWEVAVLEATYNDHIHGWNYFIPRLGDYAAKQATRA